MFLSGRSQNVTVDSCFSSKTAVTSGVPQGTVLGPLLFLLFINDLPTVLDPSTRCRPIADDCLVYRVNFHRWPATTAERYLASPEKWSHQWGMHFNAKECNVLMISRRKPLDKILPAEQHHFGSSQQLYIPRGPYIQHPEQISTCAKKANSCLGFLHRNLKGYPQQLRRTGYISLFRSLTEYGAALWNPHLKKDINQLKVAQRRAARWINNEYGWRSNVTDMLEQLGLESLESRWRDQRLILMYKIMHKLIGTSPEDLALKKADGRFRAAHKFKLKHQSPTTTDLRWKFWQVGYVRSRVFTSFQAVPAWTKWRKSDHLTGRRQLNLSLSSLAVRISVVGMTTIFAANNTVLMKGNHFALKTAR